MFCGDRNLPGGTDVVGLAMLSIGECRRKYCGGLIVKEQTKICVENLVCARSSLIRQTSGIWSLGLSW